MMSDIFNYIKDKWVTWLFACISATAAFGYKTTKDKLAKQELIADGMQALLRDRIVQAYNHYSDKGFAPIYAKENVKRMYEPYHRLGGNDIATDLMEKIMDMPTEKKEKKHE